MSAVISILYLLVALFVGVLVWKFVDFIRRFLYVRKIRRFMMPHD